MLAGSEFASPELEDAEGTRLALGRSRRGEADDRVGDRELGCHGDLLFAVLADPERRGREGGEAAGEVVEEAAKLGRLRIRRERLEAVDDHDPRTALLDQRSHLLEDAGEAALVERRAEVLVEDGVADRFRIEEAERLAVAEDLVEWLGHRGEVEGGPLGRRVREQVLLGEDRLAGSRQPDQHVDRVRGEAAAEHAVEARMAAREPLTHRDVAPCRKALFPSRSLTVETNCSGSSGFWRKASAPAASAWSRASSVEIARQAATPASFRRLAQTRRRFRRR